MPFEKLTNNAAARRTVERIELAHGMTPADQKEMRELTSIVSLAAGASNLTSAQTGFWDKFTGNTASYISDSVSNAKAKSAYSALMNQTRNNLFGATLTDGEIAAFKDAYGSREQGMGTVLAGLQTALTQTRSKLETIASFNDPAVIKFRTGKTLDEINAAMNMIDIKLAMYDDVERGRLTPDEAVKKIKQATVNTSAPTQNAPSTGGQTQQQVTDALFN